MATNPHSEDPSRITVCVLAGGSKGNAIYISDDSTTILLDAGLSGAELERRLILKGLNPENLDAILVSHEHTDHIQGVGVLSRRFRLPVYINAATLQAASSRLGRLNGENIFECGIPFSINTLSIHPFSVSHDAKDPAGFTINSNSVKIGIATDLGIATSLVKEHLKDCSILILEANHDPEMLAAGPYPWPLKQRIQGRNGHLSNEDSKNLLKKVQHRNLKHVILSHLSETNNTPEKAISVVGRAIKHCGTRITAADGNAGSALLHIEE